MPSIFSCFSNKTTNINFVCTNGYGLHGHLEHMKKEEVCSESGEGITRTEEGDERRVIILYQ